MTGPIEMLPEMGTICPHTAVGLPSPSPTASAHSSSADIAALSKPPIPTSRFEGHIINFADGSRWRLLKALSHIKLQQEHAPCEGTQAFTCRCINRKRYKIGEAVIKIKFQVRAHERTTRDYESYLASCEENFKVFPKPAEIMEEKLSDIRSTIDSCAHPTELINYNTWDEIAALDRFGALGCKHAPALVDIALKNVPAGVHEYAIEGGYLICILMTKLPGRALTHCNFWQLPVDERDEIRSAFKRAILLVWECGVEPKDCAMRNILWDKDGRECYIVDFEECYFGTDDSTVAIWNDDTYKFWGIAEECNASE